MANPKRHDVFPLTGTKLPQGIYYLTKNREQSDRLLPSLVISDYQNQETAKVYFDDPFYRISMPLEASYIFEGDIALVTQNAIRILLSRVANSNTLLVTERCNNRCLFCSQPPKEVDDEILLSMAAMALIGFDTSGQVGISGGEPLLYGDKFCSFLEVLDQNNVKSSLHILTNGRALSDPRYVSKIAKAKSDINITFGIPLYSTEAEIHDRLVGAKGAWQETIQGIINTMFSVIPIEIRFIPNQFNIEDIDKIGAFVSRTLPTLSQLSIMNLEPKGWARKNWDDLYLPPPHYIDRMRKSIADCNDAGLTVRLFNYSLCHLPEDLHPFAVKSISDWKNEFTASCENCLKMNECCGFFTSAIGKYSEQPRAFI